MTQYLIRQLRKDDLKQMHRSFLEAFSDYPVSMKVSYPQFEQRMLGKLHINFDLSFGAFSGQKLVGFVFHSLNKFEGVDTIYNGGMGVIPGHRGNRLSSQLYEAFLGVGKAHAERCLLEVITVNDVAYRVYENIGFKQRGLYKCFKLTGPLKIESEKAEGLQMREGSFEKQQLYSSFDSFETSFSDTFLQLAHNVSIETFVECHLAGEAVGYIVFQAASGRITRMAVAQNYRRRGIGLRLLHEALRMSGGKNLTVINVASSAKELSDFLLNVGFENQIDQWEMELSLR
jgi:ribosomal protein S18 acetylase RimI-like enzyme